MHHLQILSLGRQAQLHNFRLHERIRDTLTCGIVEQGYHQMNRSAPTGHAIMHATFLMIDRMTLNDLGRHQANIDCHSVGNLEISGYDFRHRNIGGHHAGQQ